MHVFEISADFIYCDRVLFQNKSNIQHHEAQKFNKLNINAFILDLQLWVN